MGDNSWGVGGNIYICSRRRRQRPLISSKISSLELNLRLALLRYAIIKQKGV